MLEEYGIGWRNTFEKHLSTVLTVFPDTVVSNIERHSGMLRVDFRSKNDDLEFILSCVSYRIERLSATQCENCDTRGIRRVGDNRLPVIKCLCSGCYALELDKALSANPS